MVLGRICSRAAWFLTNDEGGEGDDELEEGEEEDVGMTDGSLVESDLVKLSPGPGSDCIFPPPPPRVQLSLFFFFFEVLSPLYHGFQFVLGGHTLNRMKGKRISTLFSFKFIFFLIPFRRG